MDHATVTDYTYGNNINNENTKVKVYVRVRPNIDNIELSKDIFPRPGETQVFQLSILIFNLIRKT